MIAIVRRRGAADGACRALAYGAVVLQAGYGLISIGNASFTRYTVVFEPVVILVLVAGTAMALRYLFANSDTDSMSPVAAADGFEDVVDVGAFLADRRFVPAFNALAVLDVDTRRAAQILMED